MSIYLLESVCTSHLSGPICRDKVCVIAAKSLCTSRTFIAGYFKHIFLNSSHSYIFGISFKMSPQPNKMRSSTWDIIIIRPGLFTNCKKFPENRSWKVTTIWVVPAENFQDQRNRLKCAPVFYFRTEYSKLKFVFHLLEAIFDTSFRPKQNAIPVRKWCGYAHAWGIGQASRACKCCWRRTRYKAYPDQPKKSRKTI